MTPLDAITTWIYDAAKNSDETFGFYESLIGQGFHQLQLFQGANKIIWSATNNLPEAGVGTNWGARAVEIANQMNSILSGVDAPLVSDRVVDEPDPVIYVDPPPPPETRGDEPIVFNDPLIDTRVDDLIRPNEPVIRNLGVLTVPVKKPSMLPWLVIAGLVYLSSR